MKLKELCKNMKIEITNDVEITGITSNSREVKAGYMFIALKGAHNDGYTFISDAISKGANAIVSDKDFQREFQGAKLLVNDTYSFSLDAAPAFYNYPSKKLNLIGITGTNGKTTISYLLESIYSEHKHKTGVMGTISYRILNHEEAAINTTPQAVELQRVLSDMVSVGVETVCMEVSSHALALDRVRGTEFDVAIFTNLTQDHLDFHKTMDEYLLAKKILFDNVGMNNKRYKKAAVINGDDPYSLKIAADTKAPVITYGGKKDYDVHFKDVEYSMTGIKGVLVFKNAGELLFEANLIGKHNMYNICGAAAAAYAQGVAINEIGRGISALKAVPGRCEVIKEGQNFTCIIDYAHTEDALRNILSIAKSFKPKKIITVFGCGGNRDRNKRPVMGQVAVVNSDYVIVTSDNPRDEDPLRIALDIELGIKRIAHNNYEVIIDREEAIRKAIHMAGKDDVVVIAGKGHEKYQIIKEKKFHFDDRETSRRVIRGILSNNDDMLLFNDKK
ncbi:MAG: UDP-N-acetylmuramoyl-L-alanyl-D-glutamate--2,6-diaminopimelate ligase [Elusimicrobiota bacterium]